MYLDRAYELGDKLPRSEDYNLKSQFIRAATSIVLNIAEGSTGQTDAEQHRFLGLALRSYLKTIACLEIAERRSFLSATNVAEIRESGHQLFVKIQAMRSSLKNHA